MAKAKDPISIDVADSLKGVFANRLLWLGIGVGILMVFLLKYFSHQPAGQTDATFLCTSAGYQAVKTGMDHGQVTKKMGKPGNIRVKTSSDQNFFYQGDREPSIKEGWIYHRGDVGAEIYFDSYGHVNGKGCGQG